LGKLVKLLRGKMMREVNEFAFACHDFSSVFPAPVFVMKVKDQKHVAASFIR